ncbi:MAG: hypothetical protein M1816_003934 [Peltula sp. TS41687]|nr:MAG: hypothetical protein M1816_003934 [Peltula sp. TS41687]
MASATASDSTILDAMAVETGTTTEAVSIEPSATNAVPVEVVTADTAAVDTTAVEAGTTEGVSTEASTTDAVPFEIVAANRAAAGYIAFLDDMAERARPVASLPSRRGLDFFRAFMSLGILNLLCALDATSISTALPKIAEKLRGSAIESFCFQPSFAQFSHVFGRLPMLYFALFLFTAGTLISALSQTIQIMLGGQCLQGVGAGGIVALTYVIVTDLVTLRERAKWFGLIAMMWAIGSVSGPVIGGRVAEAVTWRLIFWLNLPFIITGFWMIAISVRLTNTTGSLISKLKKTDWPGSVLFIASTTSILVPLTWGGVMYPWSHWKTLVPFVLGLGGIILFIGYSKFTLLDPLIRGSIFHERTAVINYFATVIHGMILYCLLYYLPLYYQVAKSLSPTMSGVALFPQTLTVAPASIIVGLLISHTGHYLWAIYAGWVLTTLGLGLLRLLQPHTPTWAWILLNVPSGLGLGTLFPAMSIAVQSSASPADVPFAAGMFSFFRALGQSIGVALGGVIFENTLRRRLLSYGGDLAAHAVEYSRNASALVAFVVKLDPGSSTRHDLVNAYVDALRMVWLVLTVFAAVAGLVALGSKKGLALDRAVETEQGFVGAPGRRRGRKMTRQDAENVLRIGDAYRNGNGIGLRELGRGGAM